MASGYTSCPCCGYDTVSDDTSEPELCSDCEDAGCDEDGGSICGPGCPASDERAEMYSAEGVARFRSPVSEGK